MSPEILNPDLFGFKDSRPTAESDRYALGMVILEVLSGQPPFALDKDFIVMRKVIEGERPGRPEGSEWAWFTDDLWRMLELCWAIPPETRPSIEAVLECLERVSRAWKPPSQQVAGDIGTDDDGSNHTMVSDYSAWFLVSVPFTLHSPWPRPWLSIRIHSTRPSIPFDRFSGVAPSKGVTIVEALPTISPHLL